MVHARPRELRSRQHVPSQLPSNLLLRGLRTWPRGLATDREVCAELGWMGTRDSRCECLQGFCGPNRLAFALSFSILNRFPYSHPPSFPSLSSSGVLEGVKRAKNQVHPWRYFCSHEALPSPRRTPGSKGARRRAGVAPRKLSFCALC